MHLILARGSSQRMLKNDGDTLESGIVMGLHSAYKSSTCTTLCRHLRIWVVEDRWYWTVNNEASKEDNATGMKEIGNG
jgi:hypothetical protein